MEGALAGAWHANPDNPAARAVLEDAARSLAATLPRHAAEARTERFAQAQRAVADRLPDEERAALDRAAEVAKRTQEYIGGATTHLQPSARYVEPTGGRDMPWQTWISAAEDLDAAEGA